MFGCMYALRGPALHFAAPSSSAARAALGKQAAAATAASFSTDATMTGRLLQLNDLSNIDEATKKVHQWTTFSAGSFSLAVHSRLLSSCSASGGAVVSVQARARRAAGGTKKAGRRRGRLKVVRRRCTSGCPRLGSTTTPPATCRYNERKFYPHTATPSHTT